MIDDLLPMVMNVFSINITQREQHKNEQVLLSLLSPTEYIPPVSK